MASRTSVPVLLLGSLLCCSHLSIISSRAINHVEALPPREHQRQAGAQQQPFFDKRRLDRVVSPHTATKNEEGAEGMASPAKRLAGLFRCSGWGPSCSWNNAEPTLRSKQPSHASPDAVHGGVRNEWARRLMNTEMRDGRPTKFQPFFTLTSGKDQCHSSCRI